MEEATVDATAKQSSDVVTCDLNCGRVIDTASVNSQNVMLQGQG